MSFGLSTASSGTHDLFVGNVPTAWGKEKLAEVFAEHATVARCNVVSPKDRESRVTYGFVAVASQTDVDKCMTNLNRVPKDGYSLRVEVSAKKRDKPASNVQTPTQSSTATQSLTPTTSSTPLQSPTVCQHPSCSKPGKHRCSKCKSPYCSAECQSADWSKHKYLCAGLAVSATATPLSPSRQQQQQQQQGPASPASLPTAVSPVGKSASPILPADSHRSFERASPSVGKANTSLDEGWVMVNGSSTSDTRRVESSSTQYKSSSSSSSSTPLVPFAATSTGIPGFSPARLQGRHVDTPSTMPVSQGFQCIILPAGRTQVQLSCIRDDCSDIYVHVTNHDQSSRLARLNANINAAIHMSDRSSYIPAVDAVCSARYGNDELFYRVRVEKQESAQTYQVMFVDYGNTASVPVNDLRPLKHEFGILPFQAVRCSLSAIQPAEGAVSWSQKTREILQQVDTLAAYLVKPASSSSQEHVIELYNRSLSGSILLNNEFVKRRVAVYKPGEMPPIDKSTPSVSVSHSVEDVFSANTQSAAEAVAATASRTPVAAAPAGVDLVSSGNTPAAAYSSTHCPARSVPPADSKRLFLKDLSCFKLPVGKPVVCVSTAVKSPGSFWLTCAARFTELADLLDLMADPPAYPSPHQPCTGEMVACQFSADLNWYRAKVNCTADDVAEVTFMDFGNSETTSVSQLRPLQPEYLKLPIQGVQCTLDACQPVFGTKWSADATAAFNDLIMDTELSCVCTAINENVYSVQVECSGKNVVSELIASGHAICYEPLRKPHDTSQPTKTTAAMLSTDHHTSNGIATEGLSLSIADRPGERLGPCGASVPSSPSTITTASPDMITPSDAQWSCLPTTSGEFDVILSDIANPSCFYVQVAEKNAIQSLHSLVDVMNTTFNDASNSSATPSLGDCPVDSICAAQFSEDGGWYRAVVTKVLDGNRREVRFTDFGNNDTVEKSSLRPLSPSMLELPMQAIACQLADVKPIGSEWSAQAIAMFAEHVGNVGAARVTVCRSPNSSSSESNGKQALCVYSMKDASTINDILVSSKHAVSTIAVPAAAPVESLKVLSQSDAQWSLLPTTAGELDVILSDIASPSCFYVQLADKSTIQSLNSLMDTMNTTFNDASNSSATSSLGDCPVDSICAAQFSEDGGWYRAVVTKVLDGNRREVRFTDFGNNDTVEKSSLRPLSPAMLELPMQAIACQLADVKPIGSEWSAQAIAMFAEHVGDVGAARVTVCRSPSSSSSESNGQQALCVYSVTEARTINDILVSSKHAVSTIAVPAASPVECAKVLSQSDAQWSCLPTTSGEFDVILSDIASPSCFFVQLADKSTIQSLHSLMDMMNTTFNDASSSSATPSLGDSPVDSICAAQFSEDGGWYRAVVTKVLDGNRREVRFTDFGNNDTVEKSSLRPLSPSMLELPMQAIACQLADVKAIGSEWSAQAIAMFAEHVGDVGAARVTVCRSPNSNSSGSNGQQALCVYSVTEARTINDILVSSKHAVSTIAVPAASPVECAKVLSQSDAQWSCLPTTSGEFDVILSDIANPSCFYVQVAEKNAIQSLHSLVDVMNTTFNDASNSNATLSLGDCPVDSICAAQFSEDGGWYRAVVTKVLDGNRREVRFTDFGNNDTVEKSSLRPLSPAMLELPMQAIACQLADVKPIGSEWSAQAIAMFAEHVGDVGAARVTVCRSPNSSSTESNGKQALCVYSMKDASTINDILVSSMHAVSTIAVPAAAPVESLKVLSQSDAQWSFLPTTAGELDVILSDIASPSCFYVQLADKSTIQSLNSLMDTMNTTFNDASNSSATSSLGDCPVDSICAAQFSEDGGWYRAVVTKVLDGNRREVRFTDFGNNDTVEKSSLRPLSPTMLELPMQAIACQLADVKPISSEWSAQAIAMFAKHVGDVGAARVTVCRSPNSSSSESNGQQALCVYSVTEARTINDILVSSKHAVSTIAVPAASPVECAKVLSQSDAQWSCLPTTSGEFDVILSDIASPSCFYVQLADKSTIQSLNSLMDTMNTTFNDASNSSTTSSLGDCPVNSICAAQFSEDGGWYRAVVTKVLDGNRREVRFTDFGNNDAVEKSSLRPLNPSMLELPMQAISCQLADVKPIGNGWSAQATAVFEEHVGDVGAARVTVCRSPNSSASEIQPLHVYSISEARTISDILVSSTHAVSTIVKEAAVPVERPRFLSPSDAQWSCLPATAGEFGIILSDIANPSCFYVQLADKGTIQSLHSLMDTMNTTFNDASNSSTTSSLGDCPVDSLCAAQFSEDGGWYRAVVTKVLDGNRREVRFTDFGNNDTVEKSSLRPLSPSMLELPMQAIVCQLADVKPIGSEWSAQAIAVFAEHVGDVGAARVTVCRSPNSSSSESNGKQALCVYSMKDASTINDILVSSKHAVSTIAVPAASPVECAKVLSQSDAQWSCLPTTSGEFDVILSDVASPSCFFVQLADKSAIQSLNSLMDTMNTTFSDAPNSSATASLGDCPVDSICAAQFSEDGGWYRAVVTKVLDGNRREVRFTDFGNNDTVEKSSLRPLSPTMLELPMQAIACQLADVKPVGNGWSAQAIAMFAEHVGDVGAARVTVCRSPSSSSSESNGKQALCVYSVTEARTINDILVSSSHAVLLS